MAPVRRLNQLLKELDPTHPPSIGTLKLGDITYEVQASVHPSRLPRAYLSTPDKASRTVLAGEGKKEPSELLELSSSELSDLPKSVWEDLRFLLQKYLLGQDVFLVSQPGPYARRLALLFASLINAEYEYIALHRDVGETELKQGREIRQGGNLVYVDSPAVNAVKHGRLLILEGIEKAERGIMPVLNNLLENREMNLDDGTHIIHPHRYAQLDSTLVRGPDGNHAKSFIPAHRRFRVIAIAAPVPPYPGYPLDPPFRSRFQARFVDPISSSLALSSTISQPSTISASQTHQNGISERVFEKIRDIILSTQYASESQHAIQVVSRSQLPPFPQTALAKLRAITTFFPPPLSNAEGVIPPGQLARLFLTIHPALTHAPFTAWALLSRQTSEAGLGELGTPWMIAQNEPLALFGYRLTSIERETSTTARVTFTSISQDENGQTGQATSTVVHRVPAGPRAFREYPFRGGVEFHQSERLTGMLTYMLQAHAMRWDVSLIPPAIPSTASTSTSTLVKLFAQVLGYDLETVHLYKELGGRELIMRRKIEDGGATSWKPSPLIKGAWDGKLVHLSGLDVLGSTAGSLARLVQDREVELWEGKRIVSRASPQEIQSGELTIAHPSFRVISTASKSLPLKDWLSDEHSNMFFSIPSQPMDVEEETAILLSTGCHQAIVQTLLSFAEKYRRTLSSSSTVENSDQSPRTWHQHNLSGNVLKQRKLGTRTLLRIAKRLAKFPNEISDLAAIISRTLLMEFLPAVEKMDLERLLQESGIETRPLVYYPDSEVTPNGLVFPATSSASEAGSSTEATIIPRFSASSDPEGVASHVPHMDHFYNNSLQTGLMRDLAIDLEVLGEHVVLLGNQGVGKNKIVDRLCQLLGRPREYIQLHRDTTVNQLMFTTSLENGVINYTDSPLLRAIKYGRIIIIDEADKAPEHVVAIFKSLGGQGELTLSDGRKVVGRAEDKQNESDVVVHPNFRLVLLANRPGYPFLGNHFLQVLGENFSAHSVSNPDQESERKLLSQLAPELDEETIKKLVAAFHDLRTGYDSGVLNYPYSLRELINLVKHMQAFPNDILGTALRNVFDFDIYKPETIEKLAQILERHGLKVTNLGLDAAREDTKTIEDVEYEPKNTELNGPKEGEHDNQQHQGGNRWAGGTGGRDTAGLGGRGGYKRLWKGGDIKQIPDGLKQDVPDHIREKAREMARQELKRRLEELDMSASEAQGYGKLLKSTQSHMLALYDLLENLAAKEEERVWVKRQTDGELDDSRLTEGLTGESTVYKRRGMEKPELGRPQIKPKRIRFLFDLSASMYRFQYDERLTRSMETAAMLMETFERLSRKDKYVWDMYGHSGDGPDISLVEAEKPPKEVKERWKVVEKMYMIPQYAFSGDFTIEAIRKSVIDIGKYDADDWFVIAITDANFSRYQITPEEVTHVMNLDPKVHTALICIGEGAEAEWIPKSLPGRGFRVKNTADIPVVLRSILTTMVDK